MPTYFETVRKVRTTAPAGRADSCPLLNVLIALCVLPPWLGPTIWRDTGGPSLQSYADVPLQGGVDTDMFLEATEGLVKLFDLLGSSAFAVVQNDMNGNIKVRFAFCVIGRCLAFHKREDAMSEVATWDAVLPGLFEPW